MSRVIICDICGKQIKYVDNEDCILKFKGINHRVVLKTIIDKKWKVIDVCFSCLKKAVESREEII